MQLLQPAHSRAGSQPEQAAPVPPPRQTGQSVDFFFFSLRPGMCAGVVRTAAGQAGKAALGSQRPPSPQPVSSISTASRGKLFHRFRTNLIVAAPWQAFPVPRPRNLLEAESPDSQPSPPKVFFQLPWTAPGRWPGTARDDWARTWGTC